MNSLISEIEEKFNSIFNNKPKRVVAKDRNHLVQLVKQEMEKNGNECNLNHIDVSKVENFMGIFENTKFNGDVSQWDVSHAKTMRSMFSDTPFNGDISNWDVSGLEDTSWMFCHSKFNGDISKWDVSSVKHMSYMFAKSDFNHNVDHWKPFCLEMKDFAFKDSKLAQEGGEPYWSKVDMEDLPKAMDAYRLASKIHKKIDLIRKDEPKNNNENSFKI